ncbi:GAF domain-containing protein [Nocardia cyriacigeorgica]|uniref:Transcriptional regulator n=2 Tax=Nocardia cyriacigeorgica TaxID=135487 RepID=A0A6P1CN64_9NOCA|nr:GAF domain-containing protein [Nocardia cyriacigeorgica]MBF6082065.1 transcriptional regulator [Nocardia cyriacigeorgica]MBF6286237.1 transcriptional regulator [Nocardia cyriacigeorgica]MBF6426203.1 transcriptional regulator [Nocardia cyriacigeorgica]NEW31625.1 transcriptional regulator [Nocardia cyriacigeorgica]TLF58077.1 transcriptional regulator [Nocardia cyriacigeorgica]
MVSNLAGGRPSRHGVEPGTQLGALEAYAAQAHGYLAAGGERLSRLAGLLRPAVLESWLRSVRGGIDPMDVVDGRGLRGADLQRYRDAHPMAALMPLIDKLLVEDAARTGLIVVVADQFGRVLSVHGDAERISAAAEIGVRAGDDLSERRIGTNAVGMVVRTGRAAWIHGPEHFLHRLHQLTGAAAPVHDPDGRLVGVLMIAGGVRVARPEILALVKAAATAAEMDLLLTAMRADRHAPAGARERLEAAPDRGRLGLDVLGLGQPQLSIAGKRVPLSQRHAEILLLLTEHPEGLGADHLALLLDDTDLDNGTIRAAMSRLRTVVGPEVFGSRPYRLRVPVATDIDFLRAALDSGDVDAALRLYAGPVLPRSNAPGIVDLRDELRVRLRTSVLDSRDPAALRRWTATAEGRDDAAAWVAYRATVDRDSPLFAQIEAKIRVLDRRLGADATQMQRFGS